MEWEQAGAQRSPEARAHERLAVVTVTLSPGAALDRFLDSVKAAITGPVRVLVADGGSVDGTPQRAAARDGVSLLNLGEDLGRAAGANRGIAELGGAVGWVAVADPDVEWGEGALDELLAAAARYPRAGVLGPQLRDPAGAVYPMDGGLPPRGVRPALVAALRRPDAAGGPVHAATEGPVGWVDGRCLLLRRAAWESVDGFDARYPRPYDAVDLGDRLGRAGWLCVHVPSAQVTAPPRPLDQDAMRRGHRRYLADRLTGPSRGVVSLVRLLSQRRNAG